MIRTSIWKSESTFTILTPRGVSLQKILVKNSMDSLENKPKVFVHQNFKNLLWEIELDLRLEILGMSFQDLVEGGRRSPEGRWWPEWPRGEGEAKIVFQIEERKRSSQREEEDSFGRVLVCGEQRGIYRPGQMALDGLEKKKINE